VNLQALKPMLVHLERIRDQQQETCSNFVRDNIDNINSFNAVSDYFGNMSRSEDPWQALAGFLAGYGLQTALIEAIKREETLKV
jgi:hypothetical protein